MNCVPAAILAEASIPFVGMWLVLIMQPHNVPFDQKLLIQAKYEERVRTRTCEI